MCFVTPYGLNPSTSIKNVEPGTVRTDIELANFGEAWRSQRFHEGQGRWVEFNLPNEVDTISDLCRYLVALDPVRFPKEWYADDPKGAARMLFDYWGNTDFRWGMVRPQHDGRPRFDWQAEYSKNPGGIRLRPLPLEGDDVDGTRSAPDLSFVLERTVVAAPAPVAPAHTNTVKIDELQDKVDKYIWYLEQHTAVVNDMLEQSRKATDARMQTLRALNLISAVAQASKSRRDSTQLMESTADADAIIGLVGSDEGEDGEGLFPRARKFLLGFPVENTSFVNADGSRRNTAQDMLVAATALRGLLHEKNGYVEAITAWSRMAMREWDREEAGEPGAATTIATLDRLTNAMAAAHVAHGEAGPTTTSAGDPWGHEQLEAIAIPDARARSDADLESSSCWEVVLRLIGGAKGKYVEGLAGLGALTFGELPGPPGFIVSFVHVRSAWKWSALMKGAGGHWGPDYRPAYISFADSLLEKLPNSVLDFEPGAALSPGYVDDSLLTRLRKYGETLKSGNTEAIALETEALKKVGWNTITKGQRLRQSSVLMKSLGAICQLYVTACACATFSTDPDVLGVTFDFAQTLTNVCITVVYTVDLACTVLAPLHLEKLCKAFAGLEGIQKTMGVVGNGLGLLSAIWGVASGVHALLVTEQTRVEQVSTVLSVLGSCGMAYVAYVGMSVASGPMAPITMTVAFLSTACLLVSGALSLEEVADVLRDDTNQVAASALATLRRSPEWNAFERVHKEDVKALETLATGYLPYASRNDAVARDLLHRAGLNDELIDSICSRDENFRDMLPTPG